MEILYHKNSPTVIYCPPKCGTNTLELSGHFTYDEKPVDRKILLIREPRERYVSGYLYLLFRGQISLPKDTNERWDPCLPFRREGFTRFTNHHLYDTNKHSWGWYDGHLEPQSLKHRSFGLDYAELEFVDTSRLNEFAETIQQDWQRRTENQSHLKWIFNNDQLFEGCEARWLELFGDDLEVYRDLHSRAHGNFKA